MLQELQTHTQAAQSHYLVRVRSKLAVSIQRTHADGSAEVQVSLRDRKRPRQQVAQLITREVRGRVWSRLQKQWVEVRLWTGLSCKQASAQQLIELYARRWEQELFFKELKLNLRHSQLVQSQTPQSAVQELLAMLMASRVLAEERLAVAAQSQQAAVEAACAVRVSFAKCRVHMLGLWITLSAGEGILSQRQQEQLIDAVRAQIVREALPKRRSRSCDRKLRQPVRKWPRMMKPVSLNSPLKFEVTKIT
jgi:hypothetical protein